MEQSTKSLRESQWWNVLINIKVLIKMFLVPLPLGHTFCNWHTTSILPSHSLGPCDYFWPMNCECVISGLKHFNCSLQRFCFAVVCFVFLFYLWIRSWQCWKWWLHIQPDPILSAVSKILSKTSLSWFQWPWSVSNKEAVVVSRHWDCRVVSCHSPILVILVHCFKRTCIW